MLVKPSAVFIAVAATFSSTCIYAATYNEAIIAAGKDDVVRKTDQKIIINVAHGDDAVLAHNGGHVVLGGEQTGTITINSEAGFDAVSALTNDKAGTQGTKVDITASESVVITSTAHGLWGQSGTQQTHSPVGSATLNITAKEISIYSAKSSIIAYSNSIVNLTADRIVLNSQTGKAIDVRGNSTVNLGNGTAVLTINGDIVFNTPNQVPDGDSVNSGDIINAYVKLNLTEGSTWTGRAYQSFPVKNAEGEWVQNNTVALKDDRHQNYGFINGFTLNIDNGGVWNMTGDSFVNNAAVNEDGVVNVAEDVKTVNAAALEMNGGEINMQGGAEQNINVVSLSGTGGTVNAATSVGADGSLATARMTVDAVEGAPVMAINYTGITSDHLTSENVKDLKAVSVADGSALATTEIVEEGDIYGKWTRSTAADGTSSTTVARNTKLADFSSVSALSLVQWRNEINHLTKRLGDIRASESTIGAWARVYGGASEWGENSSIEMDHTTIQVGGDYRVNPNWIVGAAFSYTDSDADLVNGQAEGESYSLAAYATYMTDNGSYLDMIARYGYLKNDITAGNMILDTSNNAFSVSLEGGHMFRFMEDRAYIEPQIELTYGFVAGDDTTAANDVRVEQDDYQNLITRVGVRTGFDFPEKAGTIYAMLSYSYDFLGDADGTASATTGNGYESVALREDLGGGWVSYGIGAQFRLGDNAFAYGELERTSGGDVDNPYLFNVGFRYNF